MLKKQAQERQILWKSSEEHLRFERLLSRLSATFINLPADKVDNMIEKTLKEIAEFLRVDRCHLYQSDEDKETLSITHSWTREDLQSVPKHLRIDEFPSIAKKLLRGEICFFSHPDELLDGASPEKQIFERFGTKSHISIPLIVANKIVGALTFGVCNYRTWSDELVQQLRIVGEVLSNALERKRADEELQKAFTEIKQLKHRLQMENIYLRREIEGRHRHDELIGESDAIEHVRDQIIQVAQTDSTVLIIGETGTGKELVAKEIHNTSSRKKHTMVTVNCAALPSTLIESELFGREKGAYTGALTKQIGRFEIADGSTIFLDDITELPLDLQAKLLRVIQESEIERLGSFKTININVRIIASTNRDIAKAVREGNFREDLYYRLNVFPILVPPLRQRMEDIPLLVQRFVKEFGETMGKMVSHISQESMEALQNYPWPGNIRELKNLIERAMILNKGLTLCIDISSKLSNSMRYEDMTLEEVERRHILSILKMAGGRIRGKKGASEILGLKPTTLESRIKKLGIQREPLNSSDKSWGLRDFVDSFPSR